MLHLENLSKRFGGTVAVDNVSLVLEPGRFIGVIGRSGAGKSTLLRLINRLIEPGSGRIRFDDLDVTALKGRALRDWRRRCAMIFQQFNLIGRLDVMTNVLVGRLTYTSTLASVLRLWSADDKAVALTALNHFGMAECAGQRVDGLSGGQQQRVAIARALAQQPQLILADEPVASLDPRNAALVMDALAQVNRDFGITILCNLHSIDLARRYCDRLIGMAAGRVVFDGPPSALTPAILRDLYGFEAEEQMFSEEGPIAC
jgi:phosphonate transport system ATP-binding protein